MLFWLIIVGVTVSVTAVTGWLNRRQVRSKPDATDYAVLVAAYRLRRRFQVFQFKRETKRYATYAEREMRNELDELRRKESKS